MSRTMNEKPGSTSKRDDVNNQDATSKRSSGKPDIARADPVAESIAGCLVDQVVLVTGAARGLGAAICRTLGGEGARMIAADRDRAGVEQVVAELKSNGITAYGIALDVGDPEAVQAALGALIEHHGRLDAVINNAAIDVTLPIAELQVSDWLAVLQTNLTGPFLVAKFAAEQMRRQGHGSIVNIASTASCRAWPNASAYHASKWGLLGLSRALHAELRPHGIKVTAVIAGGMRTPFLLDRFADIDVMTLQDPLNVALTVRFVLTQPAGCVIPEIMVLPMAETSWP